MGIKTLIFVKPNSWVIISKKRGVEINEAGGVGFVAYDKLWIWTMNCEHISHWYTSFY